MRNCPIEGGRDVGPPREWDAAVSGECLTIHVLTTLEHGSPYQATAWQLDPVELQALQEGGHLFVAINGRDVPVQRIWIQGADGTLAGDLRQRRADFPAVSNGAGRRKALAAVADALAARLGQDVVDLQPMTTDGIISRIAGLVDQVTPPTLRLPVLTLDDLVRGDGAAHAQEAPPSAVADVYRAFDLPPPGGERLRPQPGPIRATGGRVQPDKPYIVGERPPEQLRPRDDQDDQA